MGDAAYYKEQSDLYRAERDAARAELAALAHTLAIRDKQLAASQAESDAARAELAAEQNRYKDLLQSWAEVKELRDKARAELAKHEAQVADLARRYEDDLSVIRAELAATRDLEMNACKEVDRLNAELAAAKARQSAPPYVLRRFRGGNEMAEGVIIENAETLEHAIAKAARFYPGTGTVFVIEDVDARKERDALRAELAAERESAEQYKRSHTDLHKLHCKAVAERDALRAKLAKRDELLRAARDAIDAHPLSLRGALIARIDALLNGGGDE